MSSGSAASAAAGPDAVTRPRTMTYGAIGDGERGLHVLLDEEHPDVLLAGDPMHERE